MKASFFTTRILHPFLLMTFFVLFCWKQTSYFFDIKKGIIAWLVGLVVAGLGWLFYRQIIKNNIRAGVAWTLSLLPLLFYSPIFNTLQNTFLGKHYFLIPIIFFVSAWIFFYFFKQKKSFNTFNSYLNTLFLLLCFFEIFNLTQRLNHDKIWWEKVQVKFGQTPALSLQLIDSLPDVYYILMDAYASFAGLDEYFDFDNSEFSDFLEEKGFFVAQNAHSNYDFTARCMFSTFNMEYSPRYIDVTKDKLVNGNIHRLGIEKSKTVRDFQSAGYEWVNLSLFDILNTPKYYQIARLPDAAMTWDYMADMTLPGRLRKAFPLTPVYEVNLQIFEDLKALSKEKTTQPRFIYAHLFMPHKPYHFDKIGNLYKNGIQGKTQKEAYLEQLQFANQLLEESITEILENSTSPPVIILQGDHGSRIDSSEKDERFSILYAIHLPDKNYRYFHDSISPVNTFRILSNRYLNTSFELLENKKNHFVEL